eukprot:12922074-Prorocentrum_lima.AAC.1
MAVLVGGTAGNRTISTPCTAMGTDLAPGHDFPSIRGSIGRQISPGDKTGSAKGAVTLRSSAIRTP